MPWKGKSIMELREEFIRKALRAEKPFRHLCQEYGISEKTGYKWRKRFMEKGTSGLADMSRRPKKSPKQLDEDTVIKIIRIRTEKDSDFIKKRIERNTFGKQH